MCVKEQLGCGSWELYFTGMGGGEGGVWVRGYVYGQIREEKGGGG